MNNKVIEFVGAIFVTLTAIFFLHICGVEETFQLCGGTMIVLLPWALFAIWRSEVTTLLTMAVVAVVLGAVGFVAAPAEIEIARWLAACGGGALAGLSGISSLVIWAASQEQPPAPTEIDEGFRCPVRGTARGAKA